MNVEIGQLLVIIMQWLLVGPPAVEDKSVLTLLFIYFTIFYTIDQFSCTMYGCLDGWFTLLCCTALYTCIYTGTVVCNGGQIDIILNKLYRVHTKALRYCFIIVKGPVNKVSFHLLYADRFI